MSSMPWTVHCFLTMRAWFDGLLEGRTWQDDSQRRFIQEALAAAQAARHLGLFLYGNSKIPQY